MFLLIHGRVIEDPYFTTFVASAYSQMPLTNVVVDSLAQAGYTLIQARPEQQNPEEPPLELGSENEDTMTTRNEFIETVDLYGAYQAMNSLDLAEDILVRINPHENDPAEIEEALLEVTRLIREAREYIEVITGDAGEDDGEYWMDMDIEDNDREGRDE